MYEQCWVSDEYYHDRDGYMILGFEGKVRRAHRVAFYLHHGYWPDTARHKCDNPGCYNPTHIIDGTQADNVRDMMERGRLGTRFNEDMPDQYEDRNAYRRERDRRIKEGTWNYARTTKSPRT